ncbi:MAG TPA: glycine zipper 2TM domain-containing protein [Herbaspirillum sp.]
MEPVSKTRIHPLVAGAAIAIILVSLVGVAAITGLIPGSRSANSPSITAPVTSSSSAPLTSTEKAAAERDSERLNAPPPPPPMAEICESCGRVENIREIKHAAKTSGVGIAAGAVVGGLLGNQIGSGNGRLLGTVAGAAGGGYAGNEIEKRTHTTTSYEVIVRMENGRIREFPEAAGAWRIGDPVRVVNGHLRSRG